MPTAMPDPYALPAFIISIIGLVVACLAAVTGIASLIWQILVRTRGAHRVVVEATPNMMIMGAGSTTGPYLQITARNRGAAPVEVSQWGIQKNDGSGDALMVVVPALFPPQPTLPYMLQAGSSVSFQVPVSALPTEFVDADTTAARPVVHLATGQMIKGRRGRIRFES